MLEKSNACWLLKTNYLLCFHKVKYSFFLDLVHYYYSPNCGNAVMSRAMPYSISV